ncbi:hypothetical protein F4779DRAFT_641925 [Xylariaceae sp. FL0662B]|nr:hypothetical protein F4779DRAFT_641925 [Xylariaceae sp. FL0662B]
MGSISIQKGETNSHETIMSSQSFSRRLTSPHPDPGTGHTSPEPSTDALKVSSSGLQPDPMSITFLASSETSPTLTELLYRHPPCLLKISKPQKPFAFALLALWQRRKSHSAGLKSLWSHLWKARPTLAWKKLVAASDHFRSQEGATSPPARVGLSAQAEIIDMPAGKQNPQTHPRKFTQDSTSSHTSFQARYPTSREYIGDSGTSNFAENMNCKTTSVALEHKTTQDASFKKLEKELQDIAGGEPSFDAPKEEWDGYLQHYMTEIERRDREKKNKWPVLEEGLKFQKQMSQQLFKPITGNENEGFDELKSLEFTRSSRQRNNKARVGALQRKQTKKRPNGDSNDKAHNDMGVGHIDEGGREAAEALETFTNGASPNKRSRTIPVLSNSLEVAEVLESRLSTPPKKKRRTAMEILQTDLGPSWDAQVDEQGHRPARSAKKS